MLPKYISIDKRTNKYRVRIRFMKYSQSAISTLDEAVIIRDSQLARAVEGVKGFDLTPTPEATKALEELGIKTDGNQGSFNSYSEYAKNADTHVGVDKAVEEKAYTGHTFYTLKDADDWVDVYKKGTGQNLRAAIQLPEYERYTQPDKPLIIPNGVTLIISDQHAPYHDAQFLEVALAMGIARAKRAGVKLNVSIPGDLWDLSEISRHPKDRREAFTETVFSVAGTLLEALCVWVDGTVYITPGNHCRRLARATAIPFSMRDLLALSFQEDTWPDNIKYSNLDYMYIDHPDQAKKWLVGHPRSYSSFGGKIAAEIALIKQINVITAHDHTSGEMISKCGKFRGISCGHTSIPEAHHYKYDSLSVHREWTRGFVIVENGDAFRYTEHSKFTASDFEYLP